MPAETEPATLVPEHLIPGVEVLREKPPHSAVALMPPAFPSTDWDPELGNYTSAGPPATDSLLRPAYYDMQRYYVPRINQTVNERGGHQEEAIERATCARDIQECLFKYINAAHDIQTKEGLDPLCTITKIAAFISRHERIMAGEYEKREQELSLELSVLDCFDSTPEIDNDEQRKQINEKIVRNEHRIVRLRFEWLSARAIIEILARAYIPQAADELIASVAA